MYKLCKTCDKEFSKRINCSKKEWLTRLYCSQSCANKSNSSNLSEKTREKRRKNGKKLKPPVFHKENHPNWKGGILELQCLECGKYFTARRYRDGIAKYCSNKCRQNASNFGKTSESKKIRTSLSYRNWRKSVFERDNYTCVECGIKNNKGVGKTIKLNADHIKPFSMYPELRLSLDNGRTLCEDCHKKTNTFGRSRIYRNSLMALGQEA